MNIKDWGRKGYGNRNQGIMRRMWLTSFTASDTGCLPKESKRWVLGIVVLLPLLVTGCLYTSGGFGDDLSPLNTSLHHELRKANQSAWCFDPAFVEKRPYSLHEIMTRQAEKRLDEIFWQFFSSRPALSQVREILQLEGGAACTTQEEPDSDTTHTVCAFTHEYVQGMKNLTLIGWKIRSAQWQKDNFEYRITAQGERIVDVKGKILGGECYEIDKDLYEESKTIKPIRRLQ